MFETLTPRPESPNYRRILDALSRRIDFSSEKMGEAHRRWREAEDKFQLYIPPTQNDMVREARRAAGTPQYTTLMVPYSYGMVLTAYTYWTGVFLERDPIFQFSCLGENKQPARAVLAVEALLNYQMQRGFNEPSIHAWLLDIGKYGMGILEECWEEETNYVSFMEVETTVSGQKKRNLKTVPIPGYSGNRGYNIRPYEFFPDTRFPLMEAHRGEYVATYCEQGIWALRQGEEKGYYYNVDELKKNGQHVRDTRNDGSVAVIRPSSANNLHTVDDQTDSETYGLYRTTWNIVPAQWGLGPSKFLEKWCFVTSCDHSVLLAARPLGLIHSSFPLTIGYCEPDAYTLAIRGFMDVLGGVQNSIDWLVNSRYFNVRSALNSSIVFDPSKIVTEDLTQPTTPEKRYIRLKAAAYGTNPGQAFAQLTIPDMTQGHMNDTNFLHEFGQRATGISDALMGMQEGGGRRSATEFRTTTAGASSRLKSTARLISAGAFSPMAYRWLSNSQQFYEGERTLRIVGSSPEALMGSVIQVTPEEISGRFDFIPADGSLPVDRDAQAQVGVQVLSQIPNLPEVAQTYDTASMFAWVAKLSGMKEIETFKRSPEEQEMKKLEMMQAGQGPPDGATPAPTQQSGPPM